MKLILYYLIFCVSIISCKKDDDAAPTEQQEQPPITAENTFSCKINGEVFIPKDFSNFPNTSDGYKIFFVDVQNSWFSLFRNPTDNLYIYIYNLDSIGDYTLGLADGDSFFPPDDDTVIEYSANGDLVTTHISTSISGSIEVLELDFGNKIIFQFDEIILKGIDDPNDIITLTEGKANFNLATFNN